MDITTDNLNPSDFAKTAMEIGVSAAEILMKYFRQEIAVDFKKDEFDPVTLADKEADAFIRGELGKSFPNDLILSEENDSIPEHYGGRVWMVDPLDGTKEFIKGNDCFSVSIGLLDKGEPVFGVVVTPARGQLFYAEKGRGAYLKTSGDFSLIHTTNVQNIAESRLITRHASAQIRPLESVIEIIPFKERVPEGAGSTKLCQIALGNGDAHINTYPTPCKWDTLAGDLIVREAGGIVTDLDGNLLDYTQPEVTWKRSFVVANSRELLDQILGYLKGN